MEVNVHEIFREIYSMESCLINLNFKNPLDSLSMYHKILFIHLIVFKYISK